MTKLLGILGGMGPLASAEFLKTIYEYGISDLEQRSPACILYSDPTLPDRTQAIVNGEEALLASALVNALDMLVHLGASKCDRLHHLASSAAVPERQDTVPRWTHSRGSGEDAKTSFATMQQRRAPGAGIRAAPKLAVSGKVGYASRRRRSARYPRFDLPDETKSSRRCDRREA